jgi:hypothetical protein
VQLLHKPAVKALLRHRPAGDLLHELHAIEAPQLAATVLRLVTVNLPQDLDVIPAHPDCPTPFPASLR